MCSAAVPVLVPTTSASVRCLRVSTPTYGTKTGTRASDDAGGTGGRSRTFMLLFQASVDDYLIGERDGDLEHVERPRQPRSARSQGRRAAAEDGRRSRG